MHDANAGQLKVNPQPTDRRPSAAERRQLQRRAAAAKKRAAKLLAGPLQGAAVNLTKDFRKQALHNRERRARLSESQQLRDWEFEKLDFSKYGMTGMELGQGYRQARSQGYDGSFSDWKQNLERSVLGGNGIDEQMAGRMQWMNRADHQDIARGLLQQKEINQRQAQQQQQQQAAQQRILQQQQVVDQARQVLAGNGFTLSPGDVQKLSKLISQYEDANDALYEAKLDPDGNGGAPFIAAAEALKQDQFAKIQKIAGQAQPAQKPGNLFDDIKSSAVHPVGLDGRILPPEEAQESGIAGIWQRGPGGQWGYVDARPADRAAQAPTHSPTRGPQADPQADPQDLQQRQTDLSRHFNEADYQEWVEDAREALTVEGPNGAQRPPSPAEIDSWILQNLLSTDSGNRNLGRVQRKQLVEATQQQLGARQQQQLDALQQEQLQQQTQQMAQVIERHELDARIKENKPTRDILKRMNALWKRVASGKVRRRAALEQFAALRQAMQQTISAQETLGEFQLPAKYESPATAR